MSQPVDFALRFPMSSYHANFSDPDQTFHSLRASKSGDRRGREMFVRVAELNIS